jgi:hypothetical protein
LAQKNLSFAGSPFQIPVCFRLFSSYTSFLKKEDSEPKAHASKKHFFKYSRPKTRKTPEITSSVNFWRYVQMVIVEDRMIE